MAKTTTPPLFNWLQERMAGVLLHPTSLPSAQGIGTFGEECYRWLDWLVEAKMKAWQILPLGPTGFGDSPYQSFSAFALNPYLIDLTRLVDARLIAPSAIDGLQTLPRQRVDYGKIYTQKWPILRAAYQQFQSWGADEVLDYGSFQGFCDGQAYWLDPYAEFMALKNHFEGAFFGEWPASYRSRAQFIETDLVKELTDAIRAEKFYQYLAYNQWQRVRWAAQEKGIQTIGDIPIFVALDSADAWASPDIFQFSAPGQPQFVAGVPPDYFSETGQLWGNPLFDWKTLKKKKYDWWLARLGWQLHLCDVLRVDHFRGFYDYWSIPAGAPDARQGTWELGPAEDFFKVVRQQYPDAKIIAEDLGDLRDEVYDFRDATGLPGMAILHFAFGGGADNNYLPHNLHPNSVIYPGTHDNDTTLGWYQSAAPHVQDHFRRYFRVNGADVCWDLIRASYSAVSKLAIVPVQDILQLGTEARLNRPGQAAGNWQWRLLDEHYQRLYQHVPALKGFAAMYNR